MMTSTINIENALFQIDDMKRKMKKLGVEISGQGVRKVGEKAVVHTRESLRGNVPGRDKHYLTGFLTSTVNFQMIDTSRGAHGAFADYAPHVFKRDEPDPLEYGILEALNEFAKFIDDVYQQRMNA